MLVQETKPPTPVRDTPPAASAAIVAPKAVVAVAAGAAAPPKPVTSPMKEVRGPRCRAAARTEGEALFFHKTKNFASCSFQLKFCTHVRFVSTNGQPCPTSVKFFFFSFFFLTDQIPVHFLVPDFPNHCIAKHDVLKRHVYVT